jgi:hypothetical protein
MTKVSKEDIRTADKGIIDILFYIRNPTDGRTVREMVRGIWGEDEIYGERFYTLAKLVERRLGAFRHDAYREIRKKMKEKAGSDNPVTGTKLPKPNFLPYALPTGDQDKYWRYFNAVDHPMVPKVVEKLRRKADGLNANADVLDSVFWEMTIELDAETRDAIVSIAETLGKINEKLDALEGIAGKLDEIWMTLESCIIYVDKMPHFAVYRHHDWVIN